MRFDEHDLRLRFDALRRLDQAAVPDLDALVVRPRTRRRPVWWLPAAVAAAAAVMLAAGLHFAASRPSVVVSISPSEPSILSWRSPTASLLHTPGRELLQTVPTVRSAVLHGVPSGSRTIPHFER